MISKQKIASQEVHKCFVSQITDLSVLQNELCVPLTATVFKKAVTSVQKRLSLLTGYFMAENLLLT